MGITWNWGMLFLFVQLFNTVIYLIGYFCLNDISIVDITWGLMFLIPNYLLLFDRMSVGGKAAVTDVQVLTLVLVTIWAVRLSVHIGRRHKGEDWRYKTLIRKRWAHCGPVGSAISAYLWVFTMQGLFSMVGNATCIHIMRNSTVATNSGKLNAVHYIGATVWLIGVLIEAVADMQLQAHRDDETKQGTIIKTGLWRYSRHPNYFGECLSWWGFYIIDCTLPGGCWTFYSPLFLLLLIRYVSGVRMLEKRKQMKKAEFRVYM